MTNPPMPLSQSILHVQQQIHNAEQAAHRPKGSVLLLAVSKQKSAELIAEAYALGLRHFGENYYQEAEEKIKKLQHLTITWHFIGPMQSNKTKGISTKFHWVHSLNRLKIAACLNQYRPLSMPELNVCLQVNIIDETNKSGISPDELAPLAQAITQLPRLKLRGLMTIPPPQKDPKTQYKVFQQLHELLDKTNRQLGLAMDTLSMGMSDDLAPAIQAGATIVRVGQSLFGGRT